MCDESSAGDVAQAVPRQVTRATAVDPIALEPVDEVVITTLVDNVYDALLTGDERTTRAPFKAGTARAPQFEAGSTNVGLMAEHGFSALVTVRRGDDHDDAALRHRPVPRRDGGQRRPARRRPVRDPGGRAQPRPLRPRRRAGRPGRQARRARSLPMVVHPVIWTRRRLAIPGREPEELPTLSKRALDGEGLDGDRTPGALAAGGRLRPDHRRGRPHHRVRARDAARPPGAGPAPTGSTTRSSSTIRPWSCTCAARVWWC